MPFAIIKTGGKQYVVEPGKKLKIEKLPVEEGGDVTFEEVLLIAGEESDVKIGTPLIEGAKVLAKVVHQGRAKKVTNLRYHSKTRYRRKKGHRQYFTEVEILKVL